MSKDGQQKSSTENIDGTKEPSGVVSQSTERFAESFLRMCERLSARLARD